MALREVKLELGWLEQQFAAARGVLDELPTVLRAQTPARRSSASENPAGLGGTPSRSGSARKKSARRSDSARISGKPS